MKKIYLIPQISMDIISAEDVLTLSYFGEGIGAVIDWEGDPRNEVRE